MYSPFQSYRQRNMISPGGVDDLVDRGNPWQTNDMVERRTTSTTFPQRQNLDMSQPPLGKPQNPWSGYDDEIMNLMRPSPGLEAYKKYLQTMPKQEDYRPGAGTRIASALGGFSAGLRDPAAGVEVAQNLNASRYKQALQDYAMQGQGLKETAGIEQQDRDNQIKMLQQRRAMGLDYDKQELERWKAMYGMSQKDQEIEISRQRANAYIADKQRAGYEAHDLGNGGILFVNKANPRDRYTVTAEEMGGPTAKATELGIQSYQAGSGRISAGAAASNANTNAGRLNWEMTRGVEPPSATDSDKAYQLAAEMLANDARTRKFLTKDDKGFYSVNPDMMNDPQYRVFQQLLNEQARGILEGNVFKQPPTRQPVPPGANFMMPSHRPGGY